jgi:SpoVK/Ycf46/Vps4 family AAA+-type ATPase
MYRRIGVVVEFGVPDFEMREKIWKSHIPPGVKTGPVKWSGLAMGYELTGGAIKNSVVLGVSRALGKWSGKEGEPVVVEEEDLEEGARLQMRGHLRLGQESERRVVPKRQLEELIVPAKVEEEIREILDLEKARRVIYGQWGVKGRPLPSVVVLIGEAGVGKGLTAECLAYHLSRPLFRITAGEVLSRAMIGPRGLEVVFADARAMEAVVLVEDSSLLFSPAGSKSHPAELAALKFHISRYPGLILFFAQEERDLYPPALPPLKRTIFLPPPDPHLRLKLWDKYLPAQLRDETISLQRLSNDFELNGGDIYRTCVEAVEMAALRQDAPLRKVTMNDILIAANKYAKIKAIAKETAFSSMFQ